MKTGIIYKIVCSDVDIKDIYVGATNNFKVRKWDHKKDCTKETSKCYNQYKYQYIRENGGWENWNMIQIEEYKYDNKRDLNTRERYWIETLNAKLNKIIPTRTQAEYDKLPGRKVKKSEYLQLHKAEKASYDKLRRNGEHRNDILDRKREANKEKQQQCECGGNYIGTSYHKQHHLNSKKHTDFINNIPKPTPAYYCVCCEIGIAQARYKGDHERSKKHIYNFIHY